MNEKRGSLQRLATWCKNPPLFLLYLLFVVLSIGSVYWVYIDQGLTFYGDDMGFHLSRIEGLRQSLQQGDWFPKINYFITGGLGYATGIFYPDLFLYPAALLRLSGLTVAQSYLVFILLVSWGTFAISYHSYLYLTRSKGNSLIFAVLYGLSAYRMSDVIYRAALGEILAFMVLPFAFVGLYEVVSGNKTRWWLLAIGMSVLFYAHLLSAGLFLLFGLGFGCLNAPVLWREKDRLLQLAKSAGLTILLTAYALFPMIEQLQFQPLRVQDEPVFYLQRMAESPLEYLQIALRNLGFNNIGLPTLLFFLLSVFLYRKLDRLNRQLVLLAGVFLFVATNYFPHWLFHGTPLNAIQFPWRYFLLVTFCVSWVFAGNWAKVFPKWPRVSVGVAGAALLFVCAVQLAGQRQLATFEVRRGTQEVLNEVDGANQIGYGMEFLPSGMDSWAIPTGLLSEPSESVSLSNMSRQRNVFHLDFEAEEPVRLIFPLIHYKGYRVTVKGAGTASQPQDGGMYGESDMHGFLQVTVTGKGSLRLAYEGTLVQKTSTAISLLSLIGLCGYLGLNVKKRRTTE